MTVNELNKTISTLISEVKNLIIVVNLTTEELGKRIIAVLINLKVNADVIPTRVCNIFKMLNGDRVGITIINY